MLRGMEEEDVDGGWSSQCPLDVGADSWLGEANGASYKCLDSGIGLTEFDGDTLGQSGSAWVQTDENLTDMELVNMSDSQSASRALVLTQKQKIEELESVLSSAHAEICRLRSLSSSTSNDRRKRKNASQEEKAKSRYWTQDEHQRFLEGLAKFGYRDVKAIANHVATRNATQVRTHAQKYFLRLSREQAAQGDSTTCSETTKSSRDSESKTAPKGSPKTKAPE